jgi:hypothetical protein
MCNSPIALIHLGDSFLGLDAKSAGPACTGYVKPHLSFSQ